MDDINYQSNSSIYVATGRHCYATLIKTDIHLIAFDRLVYREIQLQSVSWSLAEFRQNKIVQSPHENYFNVCRQHKEKWDLMKMTIIQTGW